MRDWQLIKGSIQCTIMEQLKDPMHPELIEYLLILSLLIHQCMAITNTGGCFCMGTLANVFHIRRPWALL